MRIALRALALIFLVGVASIVACQLLPERYAVNAPLGNMLFGWGGEPPREELAGGRIRVPEGFAIALYAEVPRARFLRFTPGGDLLVSSPRSASIVRVRRDRDGDGRAEAVETLLGDLNRPHGLDFHGGYLYVAETDAIGRVRWDAASDAPSGDFERIAELPEGGGHWTRTLRFGPDGQLYVSVGSSCNVCIEEDPRRAALLRFAPDGTGMELYATGLRNAVGFDWRPGSGELYATDNGRDLLGDDYPPCELDRIVEGGFYGWPFANGARQPDPDLGSGHEAEIATSIPPVHDFRAHNAPLGIHFLRGQDWPAEYRGAAIVALHGSWNRSERDGYRVVSLHFGPDGEIAERDFVWGFLEDGAVVGRPVDALEGPDGALYVSDDYASAIYRIRRAADR